MPDKKFDLGGYIEVKDRIAAFYELFGQGRLVTGEVTLTSEPDGTPRVMVQAFAYRTPDDPHPGVGYSWMTLPGGTTYTKGSELENTETSAWGRAIASLGILVDRSIASAQEVQNKSGSKDSDRKDGGLVYAEPMEPTRDGLIGTAETGKGDADFELRQTPEGFALAFRLTSGRKGWKVITTGDLALDIADHRVGIEGERITVWGSMKDESFTPKGSTKEVVYQVVHAERINTSAGRLPMTDEERANVKRLRALAEEPAVSPLREDEPEPIPVAEGQEVLPLDDEERALVGGAS